MKKAPQFKPKKRTGSRVFRIPKLYEDPKWIKYSQHFLSINFMCYSCGRKAEVTDHWTAHKNDKELFWKEDNLIPLCAKCHNYVTSSFDRYTPPKTIEKLRWINQKRVLNGVTFKVKFISLES